MTAINNSLSARLPLHKILNKGHKYALIERESKRVITTARRAENLKVLAQFRGDLEIIDVNAQLDTLITAAKQ